MVRKQTQIKSKYTRAMQQIKRSAKIMQSIIAEEAIDSIKAKALKYRMLQKQSKKAEVSLSDHEIDELKRYYNKYKQYTSQELKKKKANDIISNCTHACESSTLDKTKPKKNIHLHQQRRRSMI